LFRLLMVSASAKPTAGTDDNEYLIAVRQISIASLLPRGRGSMSLKDLPLSVRQDQDNRLGNILRSRAAAVSIAWTICW
jgi:hypothetical protein